MRSPKAQDAEESWTDEERSALTAHIEEGYQQSERGELIDGAQARREIQAMKEAWRLSYTASADHIRISYPCLHALGNVT